MAFRHLRGVANGLAFTFMIVAGIAAGVALECAEIVAFLAGRVLMRRGRG